MRILFVSNNLKQGGKERQIVELLKYLTQNTNHQYAISLRENIIKYNINSLNTLELFLPEKRLSVLGLIKYQLRVLRKFRPDIIHTWESGVTLSFVLINLFYFRKTQIIDGSLRYSKSFSKSNKDYWIMRFTRTFSKKVVANSWAGLKSIDYAKHEKYIVIHNGLDFNRFNFVQRETKKNNDFNIKIGMVASFTKPKDYKTFVAAGIKILQEKHDATFILVGDGHERIRVEGLIPLNFKPRFVFTGFLDDTEELILSFDIAVLLSKKNHSEGMSNSIMEYLACGLPVICTNTGGNNELIQNNETGFLVEHENPDMIYEKILFLIQNPELRKKMGEKGKAFIMQNFSIENIANQYVELYESLIC